MLVYSNKDVYDYGPIRRINEGTIFIVVATQKSEPAEFAVYPLMKEGFDFESVEQPDLLFFTADDFTVVANQLEHERWKDYLPYEGPLSNVKVAAPIELQGNQLLAKIHDWDLEANDYPIIRRLLTVYNQAAWDYIKKHNIKILSNTEDQAVYYLAGK